MHITSDNLRRTTHCSPSRYNPAGCKPRFVPVFIAREGMVLKRIKPVVIKN